MWKDLGCNKDDPKANDDKKYECFLILDREMNKRKAPLNCVSE